MNKLVPALLDLKFRWWHWYKNNYLEQDMLSFIIKRSLHIGEWTGDRITLKDYLD